MPMTTASLPPQVQHAPVAFVENRGQGSAQAVYQSSALGYRLEITAERSLAGTLHSPERTAMLQRVLESLTARVHVRLIAQGARERVVFAGTGRHAGLEVVGPVQALAPSGGDR